MTTREALIPVVAAKDGKPGCPETRWDLYSFRCSMGITECHVHGPFETRPADAPDTNRA